MSLATTKQLFVQATPGITLYEKTYLVPDETFKILLSLGNDCILLYTLSVRLYVFLYLNECISQEQEILLKKS